MIYFYDTWAELLQHSQEGDEIIISGPKDLVFPSEHGDTLDLVLRPDDSPNYSHEKPTKVTIILPSMEPFTIISNNLMQHSDKLLKRHKSSNYKLLSPSKSPIVQIPNRTGSTPIISKQFQSLINEDALLNIERKMFQHAGVNAKVGNNKQQLYKYCTLLEAEQIALNREKGTKEVYVYGVIIGYSLVKSCSASASNKFSATYQLVDPSRDDFENPVVLNVFGDKLDYFPEVRRVGDILRIHRANAQLYKEQLQLVASPKNNSALVCFSRHVDRLSGLVTSLNATQEPDPILQRWFLSSSENHHIVQRQITQFNSQDFLENIEQLTAWGNEKLATRDVSKSNISLSDIQKKCYFDPQSGQSIDPKDLYADCVCVVLKSAIVGGDMICDVWDGSTNGVITISPQSPYEQVQLEAIHKTIHAARVLADTLRSSESTLDSRRRIFNAPTTPTSIVGEPVQLRHQSSGSNFRGRRLLPGTWIRVRNLKLKFGLDVREIGYIEKNTSICVLLPYHRDVQKFIAEYLSRLSDSSISNVPSNQALITNINTNTVPARIERRKYSAAGVIYTPICLCISTPAPSKFCILGKVAGFWPPRVKDFVRVVPVNIDNTSNIYSGNNINDNKNNNEIINSSTIRKGEKVTYKFVFSLQIMDDTGEITALLFDKDAETLLGMSPENFYKDEELQYKVNDNLNDIIKKNLLHDFYLRSYITVDQSNIKDGGYKRFQIFNTKLIK